MEANIVTVEDLQTFGRDLLEDLIAALENRQAQRRWLKSYQVLRLLSISPNTLQALRDQGMLPYTKIGNVIFYDYLDIRKMLEDGKVRSAGLNEIDLPKQELE